VRPDGRPFESTWVTRVPLVEGDGQIWQHSVVRQKLARVLWMPVQGDTSVDLAERRMGSPLLWSPDADQAARLRADFEDVMELIVLGRVDEVTASLGDCLQIRPKGADSRDRVDGVDGEGQIVTVAPRGFYLRATFTGEVLRRGFGLPDR
jgi:DNA mismatch repair protein MutH